MNAGVIIPPMDQKILEQRMQPGVLSLGGFLGKTENLEDIIRKDNQVLLELGVSHRELADRLSHLIEKALNLKNKRYNSKKYNIKLSIYPGFQICPWSENIHHEQCNFGSGVKYGSIDWIITNKLEGITVSGSGLLVHLIGDHNFFEGKQSPFRIDPLDLCTLLGVNNR